MEERTEPAAPMPARPVAPAAQAGVPAVALSFLTSAFLVFLLTPVFVLLFLLLRSDFFQDLQNSHLREFAFTFITSPDDLAHTVQNFLTPAIGALLPTMFLRRGASRANLVGAILILGIAVLGLLLVYSLGFAFSSNELQERLFVENAFALASDSSESREAFDAKLATARGYLSSLQESLLFIVMTILGVRLAGR